MVLFEGERILTALKKTKAKSGKDSAPPSPNAVLTDRRIILLDQCGRTPRERSMPLKAARSLTVHRDADPIRLVIGFVSAVVGMVFLVSAAGNGFNPGFAILGVLSFILAFGLLTTAGRAVFELKGTHETMCFALPKSLRSRRVEAFRALVQREIERQERS